MDDAPGSVTLTEDRFAAPDGTAVFFRRWKGAESRAALHIVHGMAEHGFRYDRLARRLAGAGFEVWAADLRGHGRTADPALNDPGRGGLLGHPGDRQAAGAILGDLELLNARIREAMPGKPLFFLGHSWGSFLVLLCAEERGTGIDGLILSGTRGPGGAAVALGGAILGLIALVAGKRRPSPLSHALSVGPFNRPFRPNRTPFDWISRDTAEVDAYAADPLSGKPCSAGFYRDLMVLLRRVYGKEGLSSLRKDLPVYVYAGSADPVGDMGAGPTALVAALRRGGAADLEFVLYPGARHEVHSETNREEAAVNLIDWLERKTAARPGAEA